MDFKLYHLALIAVLCSLKYSEGYQVAARQCIVPVCAPPPANCFYQSDADECPTCNLVCNPAGCSALRCARPCYNGYIKDDKGCNTCECRPGCYQKPCPFECPHGTYLDRAGCPTCQCKPQPLACHRDVAPLCTRGVCPHVCACEPYCYPSPNDGGLRTGNTVNDFWNMILLRVLSSQRKPNGPSFF
ncbi:hypothetical protein EGW08_003838 [Elysia chlorotica]|uniref:Antistasin-like domain-containing protein n=1 Tax=Elysia chlorotica TaxID=188477 RepID=A0A3S1A1R2_ELYCH|nr:hypothetical protein EGW08_003838 [Elysia chlorotica]